MNTKNTMLKQKDTAAVENQDCSLVRLEHVSKTYDSAAHTSYQALQDVSLEINRGEFLGIIGNSGSGKSTLMRILGCEERPTDGVYCFEGNPLQDSSPKTLAHLRRHKIAVIPQMYRLSPKNAVWENVAAPLSPRSFAAAERRRRAMRALRRVGLSDYADRIPEELSGGQQQRVAIARALVQQPAMVLADEPTGALDAETKEYVFQLFQQMNQSGITVLIITHDLSIAARTRRLIRIHQGQICEDRWLENAV